MPGSRLLVLYFWLYADTFSAVQSRLFFAFVFALQKSYTALQEKRTRKGLLRSRCPKVQKVSDSSITSPSESSAVPLHCHGHLGSCCLVREKIYRWISYSFLLFIPVTLLFIVFANQTHSLFIVSSFFTSTHFSDDENSAFLLHKFEKHREV